MISTRNSFFFYVKQFVLRHYAVVLLDRWMLAASADDT